MSKSKKATPATKQQAEIATLICEHMQVDETEITPATRFSEDLHMDSLDFIEMTMTMEEKFGVHIDDEVASKLLTVADVYKFIEKNAGEQA